MNRDELEKRAFDFSVAAFHVCDVVRRRPGGTTPAYQLQKASSSASANYRASRRARSRAEFIAKLGVVVEESDESLHWLQYVAATRLYEGAELKRLVAEAEELRSIFASSYATARRNNQR